MYNIYIFSEITYNDLCKLVFFKIYDVFFKCVLILNSIYIYILVLSIDKKIIITN